MAFTARRITSSFASLATAVALSATVSFAAAPSHAAEPSAFGVTTGALLPAVPAEPAAPGVPAAPDSSGEEKAPLTREEVRKQVAEAARLRKQLEADNAALAKATAELEKASAASAAAMEKLVAARAAEAKAAAEEAKQRKELKRLTAEATAAQRDIDAMAVDAYTNGTGSLKDVAALLKVVTSTPEQLSNAALASYLADARDADQTRYAKLAAEQKKVAAKAAAARLTREKATAAATAAKTESDATVAAQRRALAQLRAGAVATRTALDSTQAAAEEAADALSAVEAARAAAQAAARDAVDVKMLDSIVTTPLCSDDLGAYPNGRLPASALCALETARGHMLRPDAARAFDALSRAYQKSTGSMLCITDSYRTYAAQVDVRHRKPTLAAVPGTSNHGLGLAVDLCGGVESYGTAAHQWMRRQAPLFGFYLPAWAQETGSKPEPWHWEFAG